MCIVCGADKKNYKIPWIFGGLIVNFHSFLIKQRHNLYTMCSVQHNAAETARVRLFKLTYGRLMGIYNGVCEI